MSDLDHMTEDLAREIAKRSNMERVEVAVQVGADVKYVRFSSLDALRWALHEIDRLRQAGWVGQREL